MVNGKRAAIIGFGGMGQRHFKAYEMAGIEISAICDYMPEKVRKILPEFPESHIYTEVSELLKHENIDIVSVATNSPTHAVSVIESARSGIKNILCEKPMATRLEDAARMVGECIKNGTRLAVNHISRWSENSRTLRALIDEGAIGRLRHIYFHCGSVGLGNQGTHAFDKMRYYSHSEPEWVIGFIDKTGTPNVRGPQFSDPGGSGMVIFKDGTRAFIDTSEDTGVPYFLELVGEYGKVIVNEYHNKWDVFARTDEDRKRPLTFYIAPLQRYPFEAHTKFDIIELTSYAMKELLSDGPISCTGEDGMRALEMAIAFHISDREGNKKVSLPLSGDYSQVEVKFA